MKKLFISLLFLLGTLVLYAQSDVNETTSDRADNVRTYEPKFGRSYKLSADVSDLPTGTYYLNIVENGEVVERLTVLIKH